MDDDAEDYYLSELDDVDEEENSVYSGDYEDYEYFDYNCSEVDYGMPDEEPEDEEVVIKREERSKQLSFLSSGLNDLRSKKILTDVTLACCGKEFPAHKIVLISNSPYFNAMFTSGMIETSARTVELKGVDPAIMETLLSYMYTGSIDIEINVDNIESLIKGSDYLQIDGVKSYCWRILSRNKFLSLDNFVAIVELAITWSESEPLRQILDNFESNFMNAANSRALEKLSLMAISSAVTHYSVTQSPLRLLHVILKWVAFEMTERINDLPNLLQLIDLKKIPKVILAHMLQTETIFIESVEARQLIIAEHGEFPCTETVGENLLKQRIMLIGGCYEYLVNNFVISICNVDNYNEPLKIIPPSSDTGTGIRKVLLDDANVYCYDQSELFIYNLQTKTWQKAPNFNFIPSTAAVMDGYFYIFHVTSGLFERFMCLESSNLRSISWENLCPLSITPPDGSEPIAEAVAITRNETVYVRVLDRRSCRTLNLNCYNQKTNSWTDVDMGLYQFDTYHDHIRPMDQKLLFYGQLISNKYQIYTCDVINEEWCSIELDSRNDTIRPVLLDMVFRPGPEGDQAWGVDNTGTVYIHDKDNFRWEEYKSRCFWISGTNASYIFF